LRISEDILMKSRQDAHAQQLEKNSFRFSDNPGAI